LLLCGFGSNWGRFRTKWSAASASLRICASIRTGVSCRGDPGQQGPGLVLVLGPRPGLGVGPDMGPWLLYSAPDTNRAPCNTECDAVRSSRSVSLSLASRPSETTVNLYQMTRRDIPGNSSVREEKHSFFCNFLGWAETDSAWYVGH
jgi:hypothetical protein